MQITFLGAAGTVTGSKYLLEASDGRRVLIDCGLFQGLKNLRLRNWQELPINPQSISAIILTHAHIDHSGYIPRLVKEGFNGHIYCTPATKALCTILLEDSARLKEEDAEYANQKNFSKHHPALPLYTVNDVKKAMTLFRTVQTNEEFKLANFSIKFSYAGHILGASSVRIEADGSSILFSGDLGRHNDMLMFSPAAPAAADYIVMESTYGDRLHESIDPIATLKPIIENIKKNKAVLLIPSFAVARAQVILLCIHKLLEKYPELKIPVYINSPMARDVTELYQSFHKEHKLDEKETQIMCSTAKFINTPEESEKLNEQTGPMVIISASGMLTGGRILHHLKAFAGDARNKILLIGYQAEGTRGAALARGERSLKFHGYYHPIEAEVIILDSFSAHADQGELINWLKSAKQKPKQVILTHGEPSAADTLRRKIEEDLQFNTHVAIDGETISLKS